MKPLTFRRPTPAAWLRRSRAWLLVACLLQAGVIAVHAQGDGPPNPLDQVAFEQRLNQQLPLELVFHDESGAPVALRQYFGQKPVLLVLAYFTCPNLCPLLLRGLAGSLHDLAFRPGREFDVVAVSINPRETPATATMEKTMLLPGIDPAVGHGWHFLTGEEAAIQRLAATVGVHYAWDAAQQQYAHPSGIMLATPQGRLSRYFYGIQYQLRDLRLGLIEASANHIGTPIDQVLLRCYHYDPVTGTYSLAVMNLLRAAAVLTTLLVLGGLILLFRREGLHTAPLTAVDQPRDTV